MSTRIYISTLLQILQVIVVKNGVGERADGAVMITSADHYRTSSRAEVFPPKCSPSSPYSPILSAQLSHRLTLLSQALTPPPLPSLSPSIFSRSYTHHTNDSFPLSTLVIIPSQSQISCAWVSNRQLWKVKFIFYESSSDSFYTEVKVLNFKIQLRSPIIVCPGYQTWVIIILLVTSLQDLRESGTS